MSAAVVYSYLCQGTTDLLHNRHQSKNAGAVNHFKLDGVHLDMVLCFLGEDFCNMVAAGSSAATHTFCGVTGMHVIEGSTKALRVFFNDDDYGEDGGYHVPPPREGMDSEYVMQVMPFEPEKGHNRAVVIKLDTFRAPGEFLTELRHPLYPRRPARTHAEASGNTFPN